MNLLDKRFMEKSLLNWWILISFTALFFFIPISTTGKDVFLCCIIAPILLLPRYYSYCLSVFREPWCKALFLLIALVIISCLWSPASTSEKLIILKKYYKFLYLPLLIVAFRASNAQKPALTAFLFALIIVSATSIFKHYHIYQYIDPHDPLKVFFNHIITGIMISYGAYVCAILSLKSTGKKRMGYGLLTLLFSFQIFFINTGKTGYLIYILLMCAFFLQAFTVKQALISIMLGGLVIMGIVSTSPTMKTGAKAIIHDMRDYRHNVKDTSTGYRIQFHKYAYQAFKKHPFLGNGTGGLTANFHRDNPIPSWHSPQFQPHSQYWFIAAETGLLGIALYFSFILLMLVQILKLPTLRAMGLGLLLILVIGSFTDSLLYNSGAGNFLIVILALCLSEFKTIKTTLLSRELVMGDGRLRHAQLKMLDMLKSIDAICTKHNLDYWLDAGTLLGAMRHQGFIPWDDDMDIGMTRESYETFLCIAPAELPAHIWLQTAQTDKGYYNLGAPLKIRDINSYYLEKHETGEEPYVQGIFIDVFVYDKLPENPKKRKRYKVIAKKLLRLLCTKYSATPMGHYAFLYRILGYGFPKNFLEKALQTIIKKSNQQDSPYLGRGYQCKISNLVHQEDIYPLKRARFESGEFNIFNRADAFLTAHYGDYMTMPAEEHRVMRHCKALIPEL